MNQGAVTLFVNLAKSLSEGTVESVLTLGDGLWLTERETTDIRGILNSSEEFY